MGRLRQLSTRTPEMFGNYARVAASLVTGLPGLVAIAIHAVTFCLPVRGHGGGSRGEGDIAPRAGSAAYASSRPAIPEIRRAGISGSRPENGRKPNRSQKALARSSMPAR